MPCYSTNDFRDLCSLIRVYKLHGKELGLLDFGVGFTKKLSLLLDRVNALGVDVILLSNCLEYIAAQELRDV